MTDLRRFQSHPLRIAQKPELWTRNINMRWLIYEWCFFVCALVSAKIFCFVKNDMKIDFEFFQGHSRWGERFKDERDDSSYHTCDARLQPRFCVFLLSIIAVEFFLQLKYLQRSEAQEMNMNPYDTNSRVKQLSCSRSRRTMKTACIMIYWIELFIKSIFKLYGKKCMNLHEKWIKSKLNNSQLICVNALVWHFSF